MIHTLKNLIITRDSKVSRAKGEKHVTFTRRWPQSHAQHNFTLRFHGACERRRRLPLITATSSYYGVSSRLAALAQQLRLYKSPPSPSLDDVAEEMEVGQDSAGKVVSQVGFEESIAPITKDHERFRPKRAYVLICIFEGDEGDLRVILTKRSSRLSILTLCRVFFVVVIAGEVSLPGGKAEDDDEEDGMTATREAEEEIGVCYLFVNVFDLYNPSADLFCRQEFPLTTRFKCRNAILFLFMLLIHGESNSV
ncbi:unnamed protein product [Cochlearia groenlandica]